MNMKDKVSAFDASVLYSAKTLLKNKFGGFWGAQLVEHGTMFRLRSWFISVSPVLGSELRGQSLLGILSLSLSLCPPSHLLTLFLAQK